MHVARKRAGPILLILTTGFAACSESATGPAATGMPDPAMYVSPGATVFINEIHYDNDGTDEGEAIEIAGPAGTDLNGWSLVLYNGINGQAYGTTTLSGVLADEGDGYGSLEVDYAVNGIQNGAPDGIALVDASSNVIQLLSYEGTFTAVDGPANGLASTDIGVYEPGTTAVGYSLQLVGTGLTYDDFAWSAPASNTFGTHNAGQTFAAPPLPPTNVFVNEIHYDNNGTDEGEAIEIAGPAGTDLTGWSLVLYNGINGQAYGTTTLSGVLADACDGYGFLEIDYGVNGIQNGAPDGIALVDALGNVVQLLSYEGVFTAMDGPANGLTSTDIGIMEPGTTPVGYSLQLTGTGLSYDDFAWSGPAPNTFGACNAGQTFGPLPEPATNVIINEVDADTPSNDELEFVELFDGGSGNTPLDGLVLVFFNGATDASYAAFDLAGHSTDANGFFVAGNAGVANVDLVFGDNTLQNGADAVGLFVGSASNFPSGTAVTTSNLLDAIVYDTNDANDSGLLTLLNPGQPQVNEAGGGDKDTQSSQRIPNGAGGARNTDTYAQIAPTPGAVNTASPSIDIEKATEGVDADAAPGPSFRVGDPVSWTYVVTNDGDVRLDAVVVTDDQGVVVLCPRSTLYAGASMTCAGSGAVSWGPYTNLGTATGTPPVGLPDVSDSDASHYLGVLEVGIDVRPGDPSNEINLGAAGRLPVAILTTPGFDAATVDPATVTLGDGDGDDTAVAARNNGALFASLKDVDDDGDLDLILHFDIQALVDNGEVAPGSTELILGGQTMVGLPIAGHDDIVIVP